LTAGFQAGVTQTDSVVYPWLLKCDQTGKLLWVSQHTRDVFGNPEHLSELAPVALPFGGEGRDQVQVYPLYIWRIWEAEGAVLLGVLPPPTLDPVSTELMRLESRLLRNLVRLLVRERQLSEAARRSRGGGQGLNAIRQIERDRRRLGRELHTGIGQTLAAILLQIEVLSEDYSPASSAARHALENISALASAALDQVRTVSRQLHPPEWQKLTLESALRQLWDISGIPSRFEARLEIEELPMEPVPEIKAIVYRALQEALSNLVRHSKATRVEARLTCAGEQVTFTIIDNGVGFDLDRVRAEESSLGSGIGLRSIREQVEGVGGEFSIDVGPSGTKLVISVSISPGE
jgi:signal transduction histidine kinase